MSALTFLALRRLADGRFHSGEEVARSLGRSRATLSEALKLAPQMGLELYSVRGRGYRLAQPIEFLDAGAISRELEGTRIQLQVVDEVDSTSTRLLERAAAGAPSGTCLAAEWQSAGRGRRGRTWISALGGSITFSLLWRFERGAGHLGGLSLAVGAVVASSLAACGAERVQVKWPNDVLVDFRKLAGVLVETSGEAAQGPSVAVIGIGINHRLGEAALDRIDQPVVDLAHCTREPPARSRLLARVLRDLDAALDRFAREGFAPFRDTWRSLHAFQDRNVRVSPPGEAPFEARVHDIAPDGALLVSLADGRRLTLSSAELSLRPR
ncbi:MAG TPA: biotin--[acetyl-CoA-carboxylase] ligase [Usitatibacter sp.]|nr:biotin--[acetyl-CoA-carboxylase] ligase [Usitatibacter sp.]